MLNFSRRIILEPRDLWWERLGVFNPAALELGGKVHLLYRAVGSDNISRFGLAIADDGEKFTRFDLPILEGDPNNPDERLGIEDPRAQVVNGQIYITYTAASVYPAGHPSGLHSASRDSRIPWRIRVSALKTRDFRHFDRLGVILPEIDSKDAVIVPKSCLGHYWLIHRIDPSIFIARSTNLKNWQDHIEIMTPKEPWEALKIGAACPPIEVETGWLLLYHGVSKTRVYSVGAALLARDNPAIVLKRTKQPIMSPQLAWEKRGAINQVVFPTGYIWHQDNIHLYYGGADRVVGLAKIPLETILAQLND